MINNFDIKNNNLLMAKTELRINSLKPLKSMQKNNLLYFLK